MQISPLSLSLSLARFFRRRSVFVKCFHSTRSFFFFLFQDAWPSITNGLLRAEREEERHDTLRPHVCVIYPCLTGPTLNVKLYSYSLRCHTTSRKCSRDNIAVPSSNFALFSPPSRSAVIFGTFLLGLPMVMGGGIYLLNLVDYSVSGFPLLFVGLLECMALAWIYGE